MPKTGEFKVFEESLSVQVEVRLSGKVETRWVAVCYRKEKELVTDAIYLASIVGHLEHVDRKVTSVATCH